MFRGCTAAYLCADWGKNLEKAGHGRRRYQTVLSVGALFGAHDDSADIILLLFGGPFVAGYTAPAALGQAFSLCAVHCHCCLVGITVGTTNDGLVFAAVYLNGKKKFVSVWLYTFLTQYYTTYGSDCGSSGAVAFCCAAVSLQQGAGL